MSELTFKEPDILVRIKAATERAVSNRAPMSIPVHWSDVDVTLGDCANEIQRLRAALAERERDAERYRTLRNGAIYGVEVVAYDRKAIGVQEVLIADELDTAIDNAIAASGPKESP